MFTEPVGSEAGDFCGRGSEVGLFAHEIFGRMVTSGAFFGRFYALEDVAAYLALPLDGLVVLALPDCAVLDAFNHLAETGFVVSLDRRDGAVTAGQFDESLFLGYVGGFLICVDTFDLLFVSGDFKVLESAVHYTEVYFHRAGSDGVLLKIAQEDFGVMEFVVSSFFENVAILRIALFDSLLRIEGIACHGRRFGQIRLSEYFGGFSARERFVVRHNYVCYLSVFL